ncbi:MAG: hypothetical protein V7784_09645 [Oceanospirillaceae bacterium]
MGQTQTVILILSIIFVLGSIAYTIQTIEERKRARKLLIMSLKSQIRNALNIYKGVPENFMSAELHEFMSKFIDNKWKRLHTILVTQDSQNSYKNFQEQIKNKVFNPHLLESSMSVYQEEGQVYHALAQLKATTRWLAELHKSKQISESAFNELGWQIKDFYDRVSCDIEVLAAINMQKSHGEKAGFHKFNIALKSLNNLNQSESLDSQIFKLHKHMATLKNTIKEQDAVIELARKAAEAAEQDLE